MSINRFAIQLINFYQDRISPYKGYSCAYRVHTGGLSCSEYAKVCIKEHGVFKAIVLIKKQFARCKVAYATMQEDKERKKKHNSDCSSAIDCLSPCTDLGSCSKSLGVEVCSCG